MPSVFAEDRAGELGGGVFRALRALGVDEVGHGLGGAQIHAAVQKGALGKLPGQRLPRAEAKALLQHRAEHRGRAVALKLRRVLPGVAVGPRLSVHRPRSSSAPSPAYSPP